MLPLVTVVAPSDVRALEDMLVTGETVLASDAVLAVLGAALLLLPSLLNAVVPPAVAEVE